MNTEGQEAAFAARREAMVRRDLMPRGIRDAAVLDAFRRVERDRFVPEGERDNAYADHPLSIGCGQTISQPYMVALMTQELRLSPGQRVLEIGTGSGYQTAVLACLGAQVFTVERVAELSDRARTLLDAAVYANIRYRVGDGTLGWPEEAPFDRIIVTAGAPKVPEPLTAQLTDPGLMVIPVGSRSYQDLLRVTRKGGRVEQRFICSCVFVKLMGKEGWH